MTCWGVGACFFGRKFGWCGCVDLEHACAIRQIWAWALALAILHEEIDEGG